MDKETEAEIGEALFSALGKIMRHEDQGEKRDRVIFSDAEIYAIKCALILALEN